MADEKNLKDAAQNVVDEAKDAAQDAAEAVKETADDAVEAVKDAAQDIKDKAEDIIEDVTDKAQDVIEGITDKAQDVIDGADDAGDAAEGAAENAEDAVEAVQEEMSEVDRAVAEALAQRDAQDAAAKAKKNKKLKIIGIIAGIVIIVGGIAASGFVSRGDDGGIRFNTYSGWLPKVVNKYNHMGYIDVTGNTIGDIAESMGMHVNDFKEQFGLPEDMPASTTEMVAMYTMPAKNYGQMYGLDFATMKDLLHIPDTTEDGEEITEDTPWGVVQGEVSIADYVGDTGDGQAVESFKEEMGLGDEVTGETKWKEVRNTVDEKQRQAAIESKKASEESEEADIAADDTTGADDAADADAAADGADAATDGADTAADGESADTAADAAE